MKPLKKKPAAHKPAPPPPPSPKVPEPKPEPKPEPEPEAPKGPFILPIKTT